MKIEKYISIAEKTDRLKPIRPTNPDYKLAPILGLAGETGELLTELKKVRRESGRAGQTLKKRIEEELGDILWYAATIARRAGLEFQRDILFKNLERHCQTKILGIFFSPNSCRKSLVFCALHGQPRITFST